MKIIVTSSLIKSSIQKISLVTNVIKNTMVEDAELQLKFCKKSISRFIDSLLNLAISYSKNNFKVDKKLLYIKNIRVNKSLILKRSNIRSRGKIDRINSYFSRITIILEKI